MVGEERRSLIRVVEERHEVVVGIRVVREPAQLIHRVDVVGAVLRVLHPLGRLELDLEQSGLVQLVLHQSVLIARRRSVVVRVVLQLELDRGLDSGVLERLLRLVDVCSALAVAVFGLQRLVGAGKPVGHMRVQRGEGVLVDLAGDRLTVDGVGHGLADRERLLLIGFIGLRTEGHRVVVEHDVADLAAGTLVDLEVLVLAEVLDVGGRERTPGHVDGVLLDVELHVVRVRVVLHLHGLGLRGLDEALVVRVGLVGDQLVELEAVDRVRTGEGLAVDDVLILRDLVGREHVFVDDRSGGAGQHSRPGLVVLALEVEDDGLLIRGLHGLQAAQQRGRTVGVLDLQLPLEGELHVRRGQFVAVGVLEPVLELDLVLRRLCEVSGLGDRGVELGRARLVGEDVRVDLLFDERASVVVRSSRVESHDLVRGSDRQHSALVVPVAASGRRGRAGGEEQSSGCGDGHSLCTGSSFHGVPVVSKVLFVSSLLEEIRTTSYGSRPK